MPRDQNDAATDRIPENRASAVPSNQANRRFGMHESYEFYRNCKTRGRNKGLFTADQRVRRTDATGTRQNPNGNRNGLECPEERDYYPYWHPTPWVDMAVLTTQGTQVNPVTGQLNTETDRCAFYKRESQNVKAKGECFPIDAAGAALTGAAAETAKQAIEGRNGGRRWYNNNELPTTCTPVSGLLLRVFLAMWHVNTLLEHSDVPCL